MAPNEPVTLRRQVSPFASQKPTRYGKYAPSTHTKQQPQPSPRPPTGLIKVLQVTQRRAPLLEPHPLHLPHATSKRNTHTRRAHRNQHSNNGIQGNSPRRPLRKRLPIKPRKNPSQARHSHQRQNQPRDLQPPRPDVGDNRRRDGLQARRRGRAARDVVLALDRLPGDGGGGLKGRAARDFEAEGAEVGHHLLGADGGVHGVEVDVVEAPVGVWVFWAGGEGGRGGGDDGVDAGGAGGLMGGGRGAR